MNNNNSIKSFKGDVSEHPGNPTDDLVHPDYIIEERNINSLPFFSPSKKGLKYKEHTYESSFFLPDGTEVSLKWHVSANVAFGFPSIKALNVHHAVIQKALEDSFPIQNPIKISIADICRRIDIKPTPNNRKEVKKALQAIRFTAVWCKGAFWKEGKRSDLERGTTYYSDLVFYGDVDQETGARSTETRVSLADFLLDSYNKPHARPIDFSYIKALSKGSPIAPNIYKVLGARFVSQCFSKKGRGAKYVDISYIEYCSLIIAEKQKGLYDAKRNLSKAHSILLETGYFGNPVEWVGKGTNPNKYTLRFYPGTRATKEYQEGANSVRRDYQLSLFTRPVLNTQLNEELSDRLREVGFKPDDIALMAGRFHSQDIELQIDHCLWSHRVRKPIAEKDGWIVRALEKGFKPPKAYFEHKNQLEVSKLRKGREAEASKKRELEEANQAEAEIKKHQLEATLNKRSDKDQILSKIETEIRSKLSKFEKEYYKENDLDLRRGFVVGDFYRLLEKHLNEKKGVL